MGTQTMSSRGGEGQHSQFQSLPRQGSFYNLTLDEVQNHLGEPLLSMNLDELIRNVIPPEGEQTLELGTEGSSSRLAFESGIQRQGSVALTRALSKKTVDEVWKEIQQGKDQHNNERDPCDERNPTFGEMTLEDFLVKAGVVTEESDKNQNNPNAASSGGTEPAVGATQGYPQGIHWLPQYHHMPLQQQEVQPHMVGTYYTSQPAPHQLGIGSSSTVDVGYPEGQMTMSAALMGTLSDTQTSGRKRVAEGDVVEKTIERRQKRMIKNRESAARSRARKQAYTNELENKVSRLEEENARLRRQMELDRLLHDAPLPQPKLKLRRANSGPI